MDISKSLMEWVTAASGGNVFIAVTVSVLLLVVGFVGLIKGADMFVDGASKVAMKLKVPLIVIGLTIVAFGTSAPEAAISITSSFQDSAGIAVGNVIGSNIMNILLILGLSALFAALPVKKTTFMFEMPFVILITAVLLLLGLDGSVSRIDAVVLIVLFAVFFAYLIILSKKGDAASDDEIEPLTEKDTIPKMILWILLGLVMIVLGSDFTVTGATRIAELIGVDDRIIGLTIVAFGTSLPELVTCVTAARKNVTDIAVGNIIGSNIFNILFVLGLAGAVSPNPIGFESSFIIDAVYAIFAAALLFVLVIKNRKLSKAGGVIMLVSYAVYFAYLVFQPMLFTS